MTMARILVVEDDSDLALALTTALRTDGHIVDVVGDGQAALERARQHHIDLVLLDVQLPPRKGDNVRDREGYDVCDILRRDGSTVAIMMLTCNGTEPERVFGFKVGADDYVRKPFSRL